MHIRKRTSCIFETSRLDHKTFNLGTNVYKIRIFRRIYREIKGWRGMSLIQSLSYGSASRNEFRALTCWLSVDWTKKKKSNLSDQMRTFSRIPANSHRFNAIVSSDLACSWIEQLAFPCNTVILWLITRNRGS